MRDMDTSISLYADDAVIYCSYDSYFIQMRLELALMKVIEWSQQNFININV